MNVRIRLVLALAMVAGAGPAAAREAEPGRAIEVACLGDAVRTDAIADAAKDGGYWIPPQTSRRMLALARHACGHGATQVTFVPPADAQACDASAWSTWCLDPDAALR